MNAYGCIQLALFLGLVAAVAKPLGLFMHRILTPDGRTFLTPVLGPVERVLYKLLRVDPRREQTWKQYAVAMLVFSLVSMVFTYAILRLQHVLPLNPQKFPAIEHDLAFNTAASFTTNTNWQNYGGENTMSYFSQMVALAFHNFASAAVGVAIAAALVRGIARHHSATVGNFWVDLVRLNLYLLLPICLIYAIFLVSQGTIQNFAPYVQATTVEGGSQNIPMGPVASQIAIKMLGTNGGGYFNANAAYPYENPTPFSNFVQMFSIFAIPSALTYYLGREVKNQKHGWAVWSAMAVLFLAGTLVAWWAEAKGNPIMHHPDINVAAADGNMEGKEVRFGIFNSALFATVTTDASCGAVNAMHDSFTPLGGMVPLFNIQTGEVIFGGVGAGLYGILVFVVIAIFIAGLMVGRTPEYLGKKIEAYDMKAASLALLVLTFSILCFTAWATAADWGKAGLNNGGPHGFSEILYAFSSCTGNNGSAFAGLTGNPANGDSHYNVTMGLAMLIGRFLMIVPILALAGSLGAKKLIPASGGSFPVSGVTFVLLLIGTILIVGALTFLPALALGPIVEHYLMRGGRLF
jgi:K+-transporting ATPase ATPase A chain